MKPVAMHEKRDHASFLIAIPSRPLARPQRNNFDLQGSPTPPMRTSSTSSAAPVGLGTTRDVSSSPVVITEPDTAIDDRFDQSSFDSGIGMAGPGWSFQARKRTAAELEALAPQPWETLETQRAMGCSATGSWRASSGLLPCSDSFSSDDTSDDEDGSSNNTCASLTPPETHTSPDMNDHESFVQSFGDRGRDHSHKPDREYLQSFSSTSRVDSCSPTRQWTPSTSEKSLAAIEEDSHPGDHTLETQGIHPGVKDPTASDWYRNQKQDGLSPNSNAAAQDQEKLGRLKMENHSLRVMLATALKTRNNMKTASKHGNNPLVTASSFDVSTTLGAIEHRLESLAGLVEAERESRARLVDLYDQELDRLRENMANAISCISSTRDANNGLAKRMERFGNTTFKSTASQAEDLMFILKEEKAKRAALSSLVDERLKSLAKSLGHRDPTSDALHQRFAAEVDELNGAINMQKQGCVRKVNDLFEEIKLLAANASHLKVNRPSWHGGAAR